MKKSGIGAADFRLTSYTVANTRELPEFQRFCEQQAIKPTYFVNWPVVSDSGSILIIRRLAENRNCELGAHIHPWWNPPMEEIRNERNSHMVNLPRDLIEKKIINLTKKIKHEFGVKPKSFRSGRWGTNGEVLKILVQLGYQVDSSVLPFDADPTFSYHCAPIAAVLAGFSKL